MIATTSAFPIVKGKPDAEPSRDVALLEANAALSSTTAGRKGKIDKKK
jgi:hypothetical protein